MRITGRVILGIVILLIGLSALFAALNMIWLFNSVIVPVIFFLGGWYLWQRDRKMIGGILAVIGLISFSHHVFRIDIAGLLVAALMIYFGYRLLRPAPEPSEENEWADWPSDEWDWLEEEQPEKTSKRKRKAKKRKSKPDDHAAKKHWEDHFDHGKQMWEDEIDREVEKIIHKVKKSVSQGQDWLHQRWRAADQYDHHEGHQHHHDAHQHHHDAYDHHHRHQSGGGHEAGQRPYEPYEMFSFIGDFKMPNNRFELRDMKITNGIGNVKIDLSKAVIPSGVTHLEVNCWVGDIHIYVPYELAVSVRSSVMLGDLDVLGYRQDGIGRRLTTETPGYPEAAKRVAITLSLGLGDITVRYV